jgi:hypothetical protein
LISFHYCTAALRGVPILELTWEWHRAGAGWPGTWWVQNTLAGVLGMCVEAAEAELVWRGEV